MKTDVTNKRDTMESFLSEGMVLVQLDSRVEGVEVPEHLKGDPTLRLNISGRFGLPMDIDDWGAGEFFGRHRTTCSRWDQHIRIFFC